MDAHTLPALYPMPARPRPIIPSPHDLAIPRLSVVVVNYCQWDHTARLVRQLQAASALRQGAAEVVVVDNHSPTHRVVPRLQRLSGVSLRRWRRNRGFARAVNEGCRLSRGDWLLLLNPDVTLEPGFLDKVLAHAERLAVRDPRVGVIGFALRDPDGQRQLSTGPFPNLTSTLARLLLPRARRKYTRAATGGPTPVNWVTGCCLLVRRRCWEELRGLDSDFFLYYEDVDLCRRARAAGWNVWHDPAPTVMHHHPLHRRSVSSHLRLITRHALLTYARKHWPAWQLRLLARIVGIEAWLRQGRARLRERDEDAHTFRELGLVTRDFLENQPEVAGRRLRRAVRREEERRAARPIGRNSQP